MCIKLSTLFLVASLCSSLVYSAENDPKSSLEISGRIMLDYDNFEAVFNNGESDSDLHLRRARLTAKYQFNQHLNTKIQFAYDESNNKLEAKDLYLKYSGWQFAEITVGKFKEPFGLEYSTSSKNILTIARSMSTRAFAPGRHYGLGLSSLKKNATWALGIFDATDEDDLFNHYAITGRATYVLYNQKNNLLHIGMSASWREGLPERYQINENMEVFSAKKIVESANLPLDTLTHYSIESAWRYNSLLLQGEYTTQHAQVKENHGALDANFSGYYLQASYLITGEQHRYKKGRFIHLTPQGHYGAVELVARYSTLNATDNNRGHQASNQTLGVNYYVNKQLRIMFNYLYGDLEGVNAQEQSTGNAYSVRIQYNF